MQSATKVPISFEKLSDMCSSQLGESLVSAEAFNDGWFNAAYGLEFASGESAVIKIAPPFDIEVMTYEKEIIRAEHEVMTLLQGKISLPKLIFADLDGTQFGRAFIVMQRLNGTTLNKVVDALTESSLRQIRAKLGQTVQAVHAVKSATFGMIVGPRFQSWPQAFSKLLLDVIADGKRKNVELPYDACLELLAATQGFLNEVTEPSLVHWDLWEGNVFVDPATGEFVGIIDFERALYADPLIEFCAMTLTDEVKAACPELDFDSESAVARRRIYCLYLYLIMSIEGQYRHFEDQSSTNWARQKLTECLAE